MEAETIPQWTLASLVASNVRAEMGRGQVTQTAMARILGITKSAMSNRYRGATPYTLRDLELVAAELNMPAYQLLMNGDER